MAKFRIGASDIEGEYIQYTPLKEEWNEYLVGDHIIRLKVVVSDIFKAKDQVDAQGNPVFYVQSGNV
jgi:hypothetical protein